MLASSSSEVQIMQFLSRFRVILAQTASKSNIYVPYLSVSSRFHNLDGKEFHKCRHPYARAIVHEAFSFSFARIEPDLMSLTLRT